MSPLATAAATIIAAASAAAAVGSFFAYLHFSARSEAHAARDEALALAETRRETIADLRRRLETLEQQLAETAAALHRSEADARENAYRMQRFYASSLAELLRGVRSDLEASPPNVERPLARIRRLLDDGERPAA
jgi:Skp family chaperone for outer membrane proteins